MDGLTLLVTSIALGTDAFAVSLGVAACLSPLTSRHVFRLTWHFGLFQAMMTVIGWYGGEALSLFMRGFNHWIAAGILFFLGAKMFVESSGAEKRAQECDPTRGSSLVALSVATSIDALAVGVSFSLMGLNVWKPALFIGLAAAAMTFVGMEIGKTAGGLLGKWAERAGGAVLVAIGARILFEHLAR